MAVLLGQKENIKVFKMDIRFKVFKGCVLVAVGKKAEVALRCHRTRLRTMKPLIS